MTKRTWAGLASVIGVLGLVWLVWAGELGSGGGSSFPTALDTNTSLEYDAPAANKTKARAAVPNDNSGAIIAIETELGTDPSGSTADVKTYLQTAHNADGTHKTGLALTSPVLTTPVLSGTTTGTYTLGGTPTIPASGLTGTITSATQDLITRVGTLAAGLIPQARIEGYTGSVAWTPNGGSAIASGTNYSTSVTITGVAFGDYVLLGNSVDLSYNLILHGKVSAINTVDVGVYCAILTSCGSQAAMTTYIRVLKRA